MAAAEAELREQRNEFSTMASAGQRQVDLLVTQGEIYAGEQRQRREIEENELLAPQVRAVEKFVRNDIGPKWAHHVADGRDGGTKGREMIGSYLAPRMNEEMAFANIVQNDQLQLDDDKYGGDGDA